MGDEPLERPRTWGGYRVLPSSFEFWQGRPSRLQCQAYRAADGIRAKVGGGCVPVLRGQIVL